MQKTCSPSWRHVYHARVREIYLLWCTSNIFMVFYRTVPHQQKHKIWTSPTKMWISRNMLFWAHSEDQWNYGDVICTLGNNIFFVALGSIAAARKVHKLGTSVTRRGQHWNGDSDRISTRFIFHIFETFTMKPPSSSSNSSLRFFRQITGMHKTERIMKNW